MFNGALADMSLTTNPWTLGRYTFAAGNPTTLVEYDGHLAVRDIDGGGSGGELTPEMAPADPNEVYFYELPGGGPNEEELANYIAEWLGLPHVPDPVSGLGPTSQHSDPLLATMQIVSAYCATWHERGDAPACSEEFYDAVQQDLEGLWYDDHHPFVSASLCEGVCGAFTIADGSLYLSFGVGCCGAGVTLGSTDVPAQYQRGQSWVACVSYYAGPCQMWGRATPDYPYGQYRGYGWSGGGITFGIKAGVEAGPVQTYELVKLW
jgi:hypothetical protein